MKIDKVTEMTRFIDESGFKIPVFDNIDKMDKLIAKMGPWVLKDETVQGNLLILGQFGVFADMAKWAYLAYFGTDPVAMEAPLNRAYRYATLMNELKIKNRKEASGAFEGAFERAVAAVGEEVVEQVLEESAKYPCLARTRIECLLLMTVAGDRISHVDRMIFEDICS